MTLPLRSLKKEFLSHYDLLPGVDGWQNKPDNKSPRTVLLLSMMATFLFVSARPPCPPSSKTPWSPRAFHAVIIRYDSSLQTGICQALNVERRSMPLSRLGDCGDYLPSRGAYPARRPLYACATTPSALNYASAKTVALLQPVADGVHHETQHSLHIHLSWSARCRCLPARDWTRSSWLVRWCCRHPYAG